VKRVHEVHVSTARNPLQHQHVWAMFSSRCAESACTQKMSATKQLPGRGHLQTGAIESNGQTRAASCSTPQQGAEGK
jgi:hypothetical protein